VLRDDVGVHGCVGLRVDAVHLNERGLPADEQRWRAYLTDGRAAGARLLLRGLRRAGVPRRLSRGPAPAFGDHIRAGWIAHATRHPCGALWRQSTAGSDQSPQLV
jgi:hypothetical protein